MYVGLHQSTQGSINHPVPLDGVLARKTLRDDAYLEVASAVLRSDVAGVAAAIIDDLQLFGLEGRCESVSNQCSTFGSHGWT
jgi:hypothetical protein